MLQRLQSSPHQIRTLPSSSSSLSVSLSLFLCVCCYFSLSLSLSSILFLRGGGGGEGEREELSPTRSLSVSLSVSFPPKNICTRRGRAGFQEERSTSHIKTTHIEFEQDYHMIPMETEQIPDPEDSH